jgi:hypothetical protein
VRDAASPAAVTQPAQRTETVGSGDEQLKRRRTWPWWLLAVIAFFLLGLWLGRGPAAKKPLCGAPGTIEQGGGKLIQGPGQRGTPHSPGDGDVPSLSGGGGHMKSPVDSGLDGPGNDLGGDSSGGGAGGKGGGDDDQVGAASSGTSERLKHDLTRYTQGKGETLGGPDDEDANTPPQGKSYSTSDFTYDKTNLPRYPDAVSAVVSSISYGPDGRTDTYSTGAGIVTTSSFDKVVNWYRENLPPGWHDMTIGDMQQLSKQLSAQSIMQILGVPPPADQAAPSRPPGATPAAEPIRISVFSPPAGGKAKVGVMIVQHGDSPVEALLQAKVAPSP